MKFTKLYEELKFDDVFPVASPDEVESRKKHYGEIKLKESLDNAKKTKLPDGSWHVHSNLFIGNCGLTTLKELNVSVIDGAFECSNNELSSLEGGPKEVKDYFYCSYNKLTNLKGCPTVVNGNFYCYDNELTSLEGLPKKITGEFNCSTNKLTSLKEYPNEVSFDFYCAKNKLTSLKGCPKKVLGDFTCSTNKLTSLEGCPVIVEGNFSCRDNTKLFTEAEVRALCDVKGKVHV